MTQQEREKDICLLPPTFRTLTNMFKYASTPDPQVLDAYFGQDGIEYTIGRIPMGSCDFSVEQYSFDDVPGDYNLTHFDSGVERETAQRVR